MACHALGVRRPQRRCCTRRPCPRGTQRGLGHGITAGHRSRGARPNLVTKDAQKCHPVTLSPPRRASLGPARSVLGRMAAFGSKMKFLKHCQNLPSAGADRRPPAPRRRGCRPDRRAHSWEIQIVVAFGDLGSLWLLLAAGRGDVFVSLWGEPAPPATLGGVLPRLVRCVLESGQPAGLQPE